MQVGLIEKRGHDMRVQLLQMCIWSSARGRNGAARVWIIQKACRECPGSPCVTCHWSYLITIIEGHCHPPHCRHFSHLIRNFSPFIVPDDFLLMVIKWLWYLTLLIADIRVCLNGMKQVNGACTRTEMVWHAVSMPSYSWLFTLQNNFMQCV
jgi:hypothetical protein